ncbi:SPX domain-containing protein [Powellomyces hirtus]|nr:SPX domain-containing protein [Powellomyces hirtus]
MKFAKYLAENSVPEWRSRYVNYRILKKLIKQAVKARQRSQPNLHSSLESLEGSSEALTSTPDSANATGIAVATNVTVPATHTRSSTVETNHVQDDVAFLLSLEETQLSTAEIAFFKKLDHELHKADAFYKLKEKDAVNRLKDLHRQCDIMVQREASGQEVWMHTSSQCVAHLCGLLNILMGRNSISSITNAHFLVIMKDGMSDS